ncbi:MAG: hypothetical protein RLN80_12810, partial [Rhodospirillales bacterium]
IFLGPGGQFSLTPLYDILTAQPSLGSGQIRRNQIKLAMSVGENRHYRIDEISGRHFRQTARAAGLPDRLISSVIEDIEKRMLTALIETANILPSGFPGEIHTAISSGIKAGLRRLSDTRS